MKNTIICFLLFSAVSISAHAIEVKCTWEPKKGEARETVIVNTFENTAAVATIIFLGTTPVRYFATLKKGEILTEFATRDIDSGWLKLKTITKSMLRISHPEGGNSYSWYDGKSWKTFDCAQPAH